MHRYGAGTLMHVETRAGTLRHADSSACACVSSTVSSRCALELLLGRGPAVVNHSAQDARFFNLHQTDNVFCATCLVRISSKVFSGELKHGLHIVISTGSNSHRVLTAKRRINSEIPSDRNLHFPHVREQGRESRLGTRKHVDARAGTLRHA